MFEIILVSVSSIRDVTLEYLNTPSNFCKVLSLKFDNTEVISDFKVVAVFVVSFSSYLTFDVINIKVVSGSTITGLTDATLYFFNCVTILCFVAVVNVEPEAALIAITTVP